MDGFIVYYVRKRIKAQSGTQGIDLQVSDYAALATRQAPIEWIESGYTRFRRYSTDVGRSKPAALPDGTSTR